MFMTDNAIQMPDPRRWFALVTIALAQLMVVLDSSIVNIALPHAQLALHISDANRQWAITAYTLTFGGFLLLGGRISDFMGRKKAFMIGLGGFAFASLLGGLAWNQQALFAARGLQGMFGALLAPAALSLLSVTFTDAKERAKAFAVYGALSGVGAAIGLIMGGLLTQYANWRWCLLVNTPMAIIAIFLTRKNVRESRVTKGDTRYDVPGAITATGGMLAIVYGVSEASTKGWASTSALTFMLSGAALIGLFFFLETRVPHPLLPLRLFNRIRGGAYLSSILAGMGIFGMFLFMTFYFQNIHGYSAVKSGLCFLPFSLCVIVSAGSASKLLPKIGPRPLATIGLIMAAFGLLYLSTLTATSSYATHVLPGLMLMSLGLGGVFVSQSTTALHATPFHDIGAASALLNTSSQIGGSFGTAIQNTVAVTATGNFLAVAMAKPMTQLTSQLQAAATVHGFDMAFRMGSIFVLAAAVAFYLLCNIERHELGHAEVPSGAH
ncbi:MAG: MFS transporter [Actinobacteria bacterium]|nr:MFS transporter [Actinomycetota bacterium]